jgi:hypothetical protein
MWQHCHICGLVVVFLLVLLLGKLHAFWQGTGCQFDQVAALVDLVTASSIKTPARSFLIHCAVKGRGDEKLISDQVTKLGGAVACEGHAPTLQQWRVTHKY